MTARHDGGREAIALLNSDSDGTLATEQKAMLSRLAVCVVVEVKRLDLAVISGFEVVFASECGL